MDSRLVVCRGHLVKQQQQGHRAQPTIPACGHHHLLCSQAWHHRRQTWKQRSITCSLVATCSHTWECSNTSHSSHNSSLAQPQALMLLQLLVVKQLAVRLAAVQCTQCHLCCQPSRRSALDHLHPWVVCSPHHSLLCPLADSLTGQQAYQVSRQSLVLGPQLVVQAVNLDSRVQLLAHQVHRVC